MKWNNSGIMGLSTHAAPAGRPGAAHACVHICICVCMYVHVCARVDS